MAPYKSDAQRKKFHAMLEKGEIKKSVVDEYDKASAGMKLPERVGPKKAPPSKKQPVKSIQQLRDIAKKKGY